MERKSKKNFECFIRQKQEFLYTHGKVTFKFPYKIGGEGFIIHQNQVLKSFKSLSKNVEI